MQNTSQEPTIHIKIAFFLLLLLLRRLFFRLLLIFFWQMCNRFTARAAWASVWASECVHVRYLIAYVYSLYLVFIIYTSFLLRHSAYDFASLICTLAFCVLRAGWQLNADLTNLLQSVASSASIFKNDIHWWKFPMILRLSTEWSLSLRMITQVSNCYEKSTPTESKNDRGWISPLKSTLCLDHDSILVRLRFILCAMR